MVFLHDIAKLELLWNTAYMQKIRTILDITKIETSILLEFRIVSILHPSCGVFSGQIPVYDTWQAIRSDSVDVDYLGTKTPQNIFVTRQQEDEVVVFCIPKEICVFIECLLKQQTIGAALMAVNSICPGVNLTECTDFLFHQTPIVELR